MVEKITQWWPRLYPLRQKPQGYNDTKVDRYFMFYAKSTAKGHFRAKLDPKNYVFLPQVKIPIHYLIHIQRC